MATLGLRIDFFMASSRGDFPDNFTDDFIVGFIVDLTFGFTDELTEQSLFFRAELYEVRLFYFSRCN